MHMLNSVKETAGQGRQHVKRSTVTALVMILLPAFIAACGGGGDDGDAGAGGIQPTPSPPAPTAEGVYGGTLTGSTTAPHFQLLVLENGDFWSLYGQDSGSIFTVYGFVQGHGTSNNGSFTASDVRGFEGDDPPLTGTLTATYNSSAKTISGTVSAANGSVQFSGGPISGSLYNYDAPASLNTISGSWATVSSNGGSVSLNVSASGALTIASSGCSGSGSINPRPSGKNVFNVSLTFGGAPCALPGQTVTGIALAYPLSTGQTQVIAAVTNSSRTDAIAVFGIR